MDYVIVYRPYKAERLVKDASGHRGGTHGEGEAKDFIYAINERVSKGYMVKNSGCVVSGNDIIFWALMETP